MKQVLKKPILTEKSTALAKVGVYTFLVGENADTQEIASAVNRVYNVNPVSVRIIKNPIKFRGMRSDRLVRRPLKKAIVRVKKGEKIEVFSVGEKK